MIRPSSPKTQVGDRQPNPIPHFVPSRLWDRCTLYMRLCLVLLNERSLGHRSQYAAWIDTFPKDYPTHLAR